MKNLIKKNQSLFYAINYLWLAVFAVMGIVFMNMWIYAGTGSDSAGAIVASMVVIAIFVLSCIVGIVLSSVNYRTNTDAKGKLALLLYNIFALPVAYGLMQLSFVVVDALL